MLLGPFDWTVLPLVVLLEQFVLQLAVLPAQFGRAVILQQASIAEAKTAWQMFCFSYFLLLLLFDFFVFGGSLL